MGDPGAESGRYDEYMPILGVGGGEGIPERWSINCTDPKSGKPYNLLYINKSESIWLR